MSGIRIAEAPRRFLRLLESRTTSFWVIGAWIALTLVWLVPFQISGQPQSTVRNIAEDWLAFRVVYGAVGVTSLACAWTRMSRDLRRALRSDATPPSPTTAAIKLDRCDLSEVCKWLVGRGYILSESESAVHAVKNRYSLLGGSVFHFGIVLLGLSLVGHSLTVQSTSLRVTEGQSFEEAAASAGLAALPAGVGDLTLDSIEPEYYRDVLLFTRLDAVVSRPDGRTQDLSLSAPLWPTPTTLLSIGDYNLAPHIEITDGEGTSREHVVAMNLTPPGAEDTASIPDVPFEISLIAYPDYGVVDGQDVSLSYNISNPAFLLAVITPGRTGTLLARELVGIGEAVTVEGYTVRVSGLSRYGTFKLTSAPALPFVGLSLLAMVVGVAWRYSFRRQTVMIWPEDDGGAWLDGWRDLGGREVGRSRITEKLQRAGLIG